MKSGTLYIVATPIGNLEDITLRALRILKEVDLIAAEDTRKTRHLLNHFDIHTPTTSFFKGNENTKFTLLIEKLKSGMSIALVSNAGTPCISDPGYPLVRGVLDEGLNVEPVPGASAIIAAVSASGIPTEKFTFYGFLPEKKGKRQRVIEEIENLNHTAVVYLSPWKIKHQLDEMCAVMPNRNACLCRELTKLHEEHIRGELTSIVAQLEGRTIKGEFVLILGGNVL